MKKTLTIILTICIALSLSAGFGGVAIEEPPDIEVSVGMQFAWNKGTDPDEQWLSNGGWSADGLWCYKIHPVIRPQVYMEAIITADGEYAWSATPETAARLDARIRAKGEGFQPGIEADAVKVFHCPAAGTVRLETTIHRVTEYVKKEDSLETPTTLAVYVEDRRVCPEADAEFIVISSTEEKTFSCTFQVHKNERVYIHVGAMGNAENDEVIMSNTITYEELYKGCPPPPPTTGSTATDRTTTDTENGSSAGLILGIVAAVVVVVGAVAFIFIKKKKAE